MTPGYSYNYGFTGSYNYYNSNTGTGKSAAQTAAAIAGGVLFILGALIFGA